MDDQDAVVVELRDTIMDISAHFSGLILEHQLTMHKKRIAGGAGCECRSIDYQRRVFCEDAQIIARAELSAIAQLLMGGEL